MTEHIYNAWLEKNNNEETRIRTLIGYTVETL